LIENYGVENYDYEYDEYADKAQKKKPRKNKFKNIVLAALLCTVAITVTCGYVRITRLNYEINNIENELSMLNGNNENLEVKVAKAGDLNAVERTAKSKLHMHKPTEEDIVYVNVNNYNVAKVKPSQNQIKDTKLSTFFIKVFGVISR
jgi:cell division protein FtsL